MIEFYNLTYRKKRIIGVFEMGLLEKLQDFEMTCLKNVQNFLKRAKRLILIKTSKKFNYYQNALEKV